MNNAYNKIAKITIMGDISVGKTSILLRYLRDEFDECSETTIGAAFLSKIINTENHGDIVLEIWDTAGQERYNSLLPLYYRNSNVIIFVFDINNPNTLANINKKWIKLTQNFKTLPLIFLAGNKCDLESKFDKTLLTDFLKNSSQIEYHEISAKKNIGINKLFDRIIDKVVNSNILIQPFEHTINIEPNNRQCYNTCSSSSCYY